MTSSTEWLAVRLGELVALGILKEQANLYKTDELVVTVPTFDGVNEVNEVTRRTTV